MDTEVANRRYADSEHQDSDGYKCQTCDKCSLLKDLQRNGSGRPSDCLNPMYPPPPWFDKVKFRRGQAWFHHNFLCIIVSNLVGLLCLLSCKTILRVLEFTEKSSDTSKAFKRYLHTINHIRLWYSEDIFDPNTRASKSINLVRRMHTVSHANAINARIAMPSQVDMVVTQWAFFGLVLTHGRQLGITNTKNDEEAIIHFWKTIGYLMGIEDRYNLAFGSVDEVQRNCHAIVHQIIVPSMKNPPDGFDPMSAALLDGVHLMVPPVDPSAFMNFTKCLIGLEKGQQNLSPYSNFIFNLMMWNFNTWLYIPILGSFLRRIENGLLILALFICNVLPIVPKFRPTSLFFKVITFLQQLFRYILRIAREALMMLRLNSS